MIRGVFTIDKRAFGGMGMMISIRVADKLKDRPDEERKVIFLDIDGVLQPTIAQGNCFILGLETDENP